MVNIEKHDLITRALLKVKLAWEVTLIVLLVTLTGCGSVGLSPGPMFARNFPPPGPPNYQIGMVDGCKTASGAAGSGIEPLLYNGFYYDVERGIVDKVYATAWRDGFAYCKHELKYQQG